MKQLPMILAGMGAILQVPLIIWAVSYTQHLSEEDIQTALSPLAEMSLADLQSGTPRILRVHVPPAQGSWRRIRQLLGEPRLALAVADSNAGEAFSLPTLGIVAKATVGGQPVALRSSNYTPYGYSAREGGGSLEMIVTPGSDVQIDLTRTVASSLPHGKVIAVFSWPAPIKDALVSVTLDSDTRTLGNWTSLVGAGCFFVGLVLWWRRRVRS
jgi:hypothetical protein